MTDFIPYELILLVWFGAGLALMLYQKWDITAALAWPLLVIILLCVDLYITLLAFSGWVRETWRDLNK